MRIKIIILFLLLPLGILSQTKTFSSLQNAENRWLQLDTDWYYQKGDNFDWAQPDFDDSSWGKFTSYNLNIIDSVPIAEKNEIVWFRKYIKIDRRLHDDFVLDINQQGASEIYLDGKLIHKLGTVSRNPDKIENHNPHGVFLTLSLVQGKEHVLAVRYVHGQYKNSNTNGFIKLATTTRSNGNAQRTLKIKDSTLIDKWLTISNYWRYQKGDDSNWAKPDFNDSSWGQFTSSSLNEKDGKSISKHGEITWFRKPIKIESNTNNTIVLRIGQYRAASEIYLDGVLIHKLGNISTNPTEFKSNNPYDRILSLPLLKNKEHVLAVRFQRSHSKYPVYEDSAGRIGIGISSLNNVLTNGPDLFFQDGRINNMYMVLGFALLMFILFLCLFLFFPREKVNGYFALSSLFFTCFIVFIILEISSAKFNYQFTYGVFLVAYCLTHLYCITRIFNKSLGFIFWSYSILGILSIPALLLFSAQYVGAILAVLVLFETIRISVFSLRSDKTGALIFLIIGGVNFIYWILMLLAVLTSVQIPNLYDYQPLAFALLPLSIAIYLGYIFGKRSQSLGLNLERVRKLSKEKESILAKQNETLEEQVKQRTASLNLSLKNLKAAQAQLVQSEKMASLGELTAGIAHEIQNPLNFVNNFSEVSEELLEELEEEIDTDSKEVITEIITDLKQNLNKINHHGQKASEIVQGMLNHSRTSGGKKELTDINLLADECLRLSYHGLRAKDKSFNANFKTDFDEKIPKIEVIPQDIGRVFLNLINNAFYATVSKSKQGVENYKPTVTVTSKRKANDIEVTVKDNGNGIPNEIKDKIFQPFFTTKPTGQGTGLGLSLSYDIVQAHGGELTVETKEGEGTTFILKLKL